MSLLHKPLSYTVGQNNKELQISLNEVAYLCLTAAKDFSAAKHFQTHPALLGRRYNRPTIDSLQRGDFVDMEMKMNEVFQISSLKPVFNNYLVTLYQMTKFWLCQNYLQRTISTKIKWCNFFLDTVENMVGKEKMLNTSTCICFFFSRNVFYFCRDFQYKFAQLFSIMSRCAS